MAEIRPITSSHGDENQVLCGGEIEEVKRRIDRIYTSEQKKLTELHANNVQEHVCRFFRHVLQKYEPEEEKWNKTLRSHFGDERGEEIIAQGTRERLAEGFAALSAVLHGDQAVRSAVQETAVCLEDARQLLKFGPSQGGAQRAIEYQQGGSAARILTPPTSAGPSGLKRPRESSVCPPPERQASERDKQAVSHHYCYPPTYPWVYLAIYAAKIRAQANEQQILRPDDSQSEIRVNLDPTTPPPAKKRQTSTATPRRRHSPVLRPVQHPERPGQPLRR